MRFQASQRLAEPARSGMAVYTMVMSVALIVSMVGLASLLKVRVERNHHTGLSDRLVAMGHARSAVDLGIVRLNNDPSWRSNYTNGAYTPEEALVAGLGRTVSFGLSDTDGSLTNADTRLRLSGIGRVGDAVQVLSIQLTTNANPETELRSYIDEAERKDGKLKDKEWWGQYFMPNLPPTATEWSVTRVEIMCNKGKGNRDFSVRIYHADASRKPDGSAVDSVDGNSNDLRNSWEYQSFDLSGGYWFAVGDDACLTLETDENKEPMDLRYANSGVLDANSALLIGSDQGGGQWDSVLTDKALLYRVHGVYRETITPVVPIAGTWTRDAAP